MIDQIQRFLNELDAELAGVAKPGERLDLYHLGRSVLIFHYGVQGLITRDFDIVWMRQSHLEDRAEEIFGKGTPKSEEMGMYLDRVAQDLPPLPSRFKRRCQAVAGPWQVLRLWKLEANDFAATKLKSFRPQDRQDLKFLCEAGLLRPDELRASLESAFLWIHEKDGDENRERAFRNLERVIDYLEGRSASL
jgi:Nucleotidyltransferase of unknown function (DUF6036)